MLMSCRHRPFADFHSNFSQAAIDDVTNNIQMSSLVTGLQNSINAIFQNALNTNLFLIGYPQFWNAVRKSLERIPSYKSRRWTLTASLTGDFSFRLTPSQISGQTMGSKILCS